MNIILSLTLPYETSNVVAATLCPGIAQFTYETPSVVSSGIAQFTLIPNTPNDSNRNRNLPETSGSIFFTDKKKNIIIDGTFTKILYSTEYFTMTGLYIDFRICSKFVTDVLSKDKGLLSGRLPDATILSYDGVVSKDQSGHKTYIQFNQNTEYNHVQIESMCELERHILHLYSKKQLTNRTKTPIYGLQTQLQCGCIRAHLEPSKTFARRTSVKPIPYEDESSPVPRTPTLSSTLMPRSSFAEGVLTERDEYPSLALYGEEDDPNSKWIRYIKISGVWETDQSYGITYKVIYS
jgi:hypothetical protein